MRAQNPPGLQRSVCGELFQASREATESLTAALSMVTDKPTTTTTTGAHTDSLAASKLKDFLIGGGVIPTPGPINIREPLHITCDSNAYPVPRVSPVPGYLPATHQSPHTDILDQMDGIRLAEEQDDICIDEGIENKSAPPAAPPTSLMLQHILGLDLNLESITRYQAKPKSMYTFLCAQSFKRNEYAWHFQNVHCDIHSNLNGWLEQRCPLASYGCTYR